MSYQQHIIDLTGRKEKRGSAAFNVKFDIRQAGARPISDVEVVENAFGGLATFPDGCHHQV